MRVCIYECVSRSLTQSTAVQIYDPPSAKNTEDYRSKFILEVRRLLKESGWNEMNII